MGRRTLRALVVLGCVVAINCGKSNPTSPDPTSPPTGGSGGSGGSSGPAPTGNTAVYSDDVFDDGGWDEEVQVFGAGGSGSAGQLHYNGQANAGYRQVTITVNSAEGSGTAAQVAVFSIKRGITYFPTTDGTIFTVSYSEDSILQSGGGNGQYSAPALRQNGKLYTLVPNAGAFPTPEAVWTSHSLTGLRQNDFRTIESASDHPDFSAAGSRMEWGFMRLHLAPAGNAGGKKTGGIDNWRITLYR